MKNGKLGWQLVLPVFVMTLLLVSSNLIDILFLTRVSPEAVKAVGSLFPIIAVIILVIRQLAQACGTLISQHLGRGLNDQLPEIFSSALVVLSGFGLMASLILIITKAYIGGLFGFDLDISSLMSRYLAVIALSIPVQAVTVLLVAVNAAHGNSLANLIVILIGYSINIGLNYALYTESFDAITFSVDSVAMATLLSNVSVLLILMYLVIFRQKIRPTLTFLSLFNRVQIRKIIAIGGPASLFPISMQLYLLLVTFWAGRIGPEVLETHIYTVNCLLIVIAWSSSVALSAQIRLAQLIGMKEYELAEQCFRASIRVGIIGSILGAFLLWFFSAFVFGFFTDNRYVSTLGATIFAICILLEMFRAINLIVLASLNATGDARRPVLGSILLMWAIGVPLCWLVGVYGGYGLVGIYVGRVMDELIRAFYGWCQWKKGKWKAGHL